MKPDRCPADQLEPEVRAMAAGLQVLQEGGGQVDAISAVAPAIYSAAISLKRIADALAMAAALPDSVLAHATGNAIAAFINQGIKDGLSAPLNQYGEGIGECIQGQFDRSGR